VIFAITIFCFVSIISLNVMNSGIATTENSLELTTARAEIDAQAAALRFIHNAYAAEYEYFDLNHYVNVWNQIAALAIESSDLMDIQETAACDEIYDSDAFADNNPFVINTRRLSRSSDPDEQLIDGAVITPAQAPFVKTELSPRIIFAGAGNSDEDLNETGEYREAAGVEGIWITAVKGDVYRTTGVPKYFDMYIRTCWVGPGRQYPTKLGTIVRLYNPQSERNGEAIE
jgi:hypothetical protein